MPRDWLKSTVFTKWGAIWLYLQDPETRILIAAENERLAGRFLHWIQQQLMNNRFLREMYPELKQIDSAWSRSHRWSASECDLPRTGTYSEPTFTAIGVGGAAQSGHYTQVLIDDLVGKKAKESLLVLESVLRWFDNTPELLVQPHKDMGNPSSIHIHGCLTADTDILLSSGKWKKIIDICPGDSVVSFDGESVSNNKATAFIPQGVDDVFTVKTKYSSVKANARHPFLKLSGDKVDWVRTDCLKAGDKIIASGEIETGVGRSGRYVSAETFPWLLGMLVGDGSITPHRTTMAVCIARSVYQELTDKTVNSIVDVTGRKPKVRDNAIYVWNKEFGKFLLDEIGVARGAKNKRVPQCVYSWPVGDRVDFIRGLLDADGIKDKRSRDYYTLFSCSKGLAEDIKLLAKTSGISCGSVRHRRRSCMLPGGRGPVVGDEYSIGVNFLAKNLGSNKEFRVEKIVSITPSGREPVYDLSIDGARNFVANGLFAHNTFWFPGDFLCYVRDKYPEFQFKVVPCRKRDPKSKFSNLEYVQNPEAEIGESNWDQFPTEYYVQMQANPEKNIDYWAQHMNDPEQASELTNFDTAWLKYYDIIEKEGHKYIVCEGDKEEFRIGSFPFYQFIDPGGFSDKRLTKTGSRFATLMGGQPPGTRKKIVLYARAFRFKEPDKAIDEVFKCTEAFKPSLPVVLRQEVYGQQRYILMDIKKSAEKRHIPVRVVELEADEKKDSKALSIDALKDPMFRGEIYVHRDMKDLISEIQVYPNGLTCDLLDLLSQINKTYWKRNEPKEQPPRPPSSKTAWGVTNRTGY